MNDVPGFSKNFDKIAKLSKNLRIGGYAAIGLDVGHSAVKIHEACTVGTDQQCGRTSFREGGRLTGSVGGGYFGGLVTAYIACNVIFGIQTLGTSALWCGIATGAFGGYYSGKLGGRYLAIESEKIYEIIVR